MNRRRSILDYRSVILSEMGYGGLPVAYWPLDETNGTAAVDLMAIANGSGHNGTINGGVTLGAVGPINREQSQAMTYNGTTGYIEVASNAVFNVSNVSIEFWVKNTMSVSGYTWLVGRGDASGTLNGCFFVMNQDISNRCTMVAKSGSGNALSIDANAVTISDGAWHHIVGTMGTANGATGTLYVDGTSRASGTNSAAWSFAANVIRMAKGLDAFWRVYSGSMAHVAFYGYILAADRIQYHYLAGLNGLNRRAA